ncbi:MAG: FAD-dependent oxidoreductase [bacterium]
MPEETKPVMVLGAGAAGLTAALALARNRIPVVLVERESVLGGQAGRWACMATERCEKCSSCLVGDTKAAVLKEAGIRIVTRAALESASRKNGGLRVSIAPVEAAACNGGLPPESSEGEPLAKSVNLNVDALFVATGFEPFPARGKPMLRYGELGAVVTTVDLDAALREDRIGSLAGASDPKLRVAFLQCVGSRDREAGRDYCSQVCCKTSLRMAARLLHEKPEWEITVFYIDLQVMGKGFRSFQRSLEGRVRFVQGVPAEVLEAEGGQAALVFEDPVQGAVRTETFGLVVLAVGMLPGRDTADLAGRLGLPVQKGGFFRKAWGENDSRVYSFGACCAPTDIPGARREAMAAVGRYLAAGRSSRDER